MEQLTNIISEISQIENKANALIQSANDEKAASAKSQQQRISEFDQALAKDTQQKVASIQSDLKSKMQKELDEQRAKTNQLLDAMQKEYDETHSSLAAQLVKSIIGA